MMSSTGPNDEPAHKGPQPVDESTGPVIPIRRSYPFLAPARGPNELGHMGGYRVIRLMGVGGMGLVFEAEELALNRRVALKVLKPELTLDPESRERFLREARAVAAVECDHVVTIYHVAEADPPYFAMQFLEGEALQTRLEKSPPLTLRAALEIAQQAAKGLAVAHDEGLVHRDIKPANLWLERKSSGGKGKLDTDLASPMSLEAELQKPRADFGRVKILDFGLARRPSRETSLTSTGFIVGTPNFMSPEQASGLVIDGRSDLFSLGCVLYVMLVGRLPFEGSSTMSVMMALANHTPTRIDGTNPAIPREVGDLVSRLLEKSPDRRPRNAHEVVTALDAMLVHITGSVPLPPSSANLRPTPAEQPETIAANRHDTVAPTMPAVSPTSQATWKDRICTRRTALLALGAGGAAAAAGAGLWAWFQPREPITIGVLHSQDGTMAVSERPVLDATVLAIEELKEAGGVLGREINLRIADGRSNPDIFASEAKRLLTEEGAVALFGCWTSASRKAVREVLQYHPGLLFYPVQYEGLEVSRRIVYMGPCPSQQLLPALEFLVRERGKRKLYFVGSDYVFPRAVHEILKVWIDEQNQAGLPVSCIGENFIRLGSSETKPIAQNIDDMKPDAIINTLNGSSNLHFFRDIRSRDLGPKSHIHTLSLSITENEVQGLNPESLAGDYIAASYFQTIDRHESREFLRKLKARYEPDPVATDPMAAAYTGVKLWARAVEAIGSYDPEKVAQHVSGMEFDGVRTRTRIHEKLMHAWLPAWIGEIQPDGSVKVVGGSGELREPEPYPLNRPQQKWEEFLKGLHLGWEGKWQPPDRAGKN